MMCFHIMYNQMEDFAYKCRHLDLFVAVLTLPECVIRFFSLFFGNFSQFSHAHSSSPTVLSWYG